MQVLEHEDGCSPRVSLKRNGSMPCAIPLSREDDSSLRVSFKRSGSMSCAIPFSPLLLINRLSRKSMLYDKLPQEPLKLTVLKLDGSSFDIEVAKTATVAEMKQAVEAAFSHLPKTGVGKVSWPHVWGNFCLSYDGHKLLTDSDYIGSYRIQDGDQLQFIRHRSINYNLIKTRSEEEDTAPEPPRISDVRREKQQKSDNFNDERTVDLEQQPVDYEEERGIISHCEYKLAHLFRGWFSYRRLRKEPWNEP